MPRRIESLSIDGPAGKIEALLEEPEDQAPNAAVLVCHPHPLHGGTMHNKVVYRIARGVRRAGAVVLRFNYRGVNRSEGRYDNGVGEMEDTRCAMQALRTRYPDLPFTLAGFSFGSRIILKLGCEIPDVSRMIAVGFPPGYQESWELGRCQTPRVFIQSTHDEFCSKDAMEEYFASLPGPKELIWIEARDHFFASALDEFEEAVSRSCGAGLRPAASS
jgi:alpha/beta superfamily hydrolase